MNAEFDYVFQPDLLQRVAVSEFSTTTYTHTRTQSTNKINILKKEGKKKKKKRIFNCNAKWKFCCCFGSFSLFSRTWALIDAGPGACSQLAIKRPLNHRLFFSKKGYGIPFKRVSAAYASNDFYIQR